MMNDIVILYKIMLEKDRIYVWYKNGRTQAIG